jgi:hypothetical protein
MILGAVLFVVELFWFGGSAQTSKSAAIGVVDAGCIGAGLVLISQNAVDYLIDTFTIYAASAQAANTFLRSLVSLLHNIILYSGNNADFETFLGRSRAPTLRSTNVQQSRPRLGKLPTRLHRCSSNPYPFPLLHL